MGALDLLAIPSWVANDKGREAPKAKEFDGAEPWLDVRMFRDGHDIIRTDVTPADLKTRFDCAYIVPVEDDTGVDYIFWRCRDIGLKETRGKVINPMPVMVQIMNAWAHTSRVYSTQYIVGLRRDGMWVPLSQGLLMKPSNQLDGQVQMALGLQFLHESQWRVYFARNGAPGVTIPTDAVGVERLIGSRDLPEGRKKRQALRHWVDEHWRQNRSDPLVEHKVRSHLRGAQDFIWNDLTCHVTPAYIDESLAAVLKEERKSMTTVGAAKRVAEEVPAFHRLLWLRAMFYLRGKFQGRK